MENDKKFIEVFDLTTKEGLDKYNEQLDELEDSDLSVLKLFGLNGDEIIDKLRKIGKAVYENNNKEEKEEPKFTRPSDLLSVDKKLQIHKIVQEYVDTGIRISPARAGIFAAASRRRASPCARSASCS